MSDANAPLIPLPPALRAFGTRLAAAIRGLSRPAKALIIATFAALAVGGGWLYFHSAYEPYGVLFTQLERDDAAAIVAKLKELKVPYRIGGNSSSVEVPETRVLDVRLELASAGLPRGGGVGFEGFDKLHIGATEFEQRVMYRRAMEGELARTIGSVDSIQAARVHLVLPEKSVFAVRREPASASIVVRLRPGRAVGPSQVAGIVHLVSAAVPGLTAERIALVTTDGATLHKPKRENTDGTAEMAGDGERAAETRALELSLEDRARAMLERVLGPGHVDVRAAAELDLARTERTENRYDPARTALRSEEQTIERAGAPEDKVAGVPGAESNVPTGKPAGSAAPVAGAPLAPGLVREHHTRNFEVDHVQEKRISNSGSLRRLTVAVVVDGTAGAGGVMAPRNRAELDKLASLVRSAVGADDKRGDVVTVESVPFPVGDIAPLTPPEVATTSALKIPEKVKMYAPFAIGAGVLLSILVVAALVRSRSKKQRIAIEDFAKKPILIAASTEPKKLEANQREEALRRAMSDPATAALVLRRWLGTAVDAPATDSRAA